MAPCIYEIAAWAGEADRIDDWVSGSLLPLLGGEVRALDDYRPYPGRDDGQDPRAILYLHFADEAAARSWLGETSVTETLANARDELRLRGELMEVRSFPIGGEGPQPLAARFSFVVRYDLPAEDVAHFQDYYMRMHPPILAEFEAIRNVFCYIPVRPEGLPLPSSEYLIGNEVVFDTVEDFDHAMASPVRDKSRADFETFPPFSGRNPHYPMRRTRRLGGSVADL